MADYATIQEKLLSELGKTLIDQGGAVVQMIELAKRQVDQNVDIIRLLQEQNTLLTKMVNGPQPTPVSITAKQGNRR